MCLLKFSGTMIASACRAQGTAGTRLLTIESKGVPRRKLDVGGPGNCRLTIALLLATMATQKRIQLTRHITEANRPSSSMCVIGACIVQHGNVQRPEMGMMRWTRC